MLQDSRESFEGLDKKYISIDRNLRVDWTNTKRRSMLLLTPREITKMLNFLLDNVYTQAGDRVFQQCIGIPTGTNCAPLLADLLLHDYESTAMILFTRGGTSPIPKSFSLTRRYIDDLYRQSPV